MKRVKYEKALRTLQVERCHLQRWVKEKGLRVVIVFEGRDGAGKGGTIRALTERVSVVGDSLSEDQVRSGEPSRRASKGSYDDTASIANRRFVAARY
jgi:hypothetical protein